MTTSFAFTSVSEALWRALVEQAFAGGQRWRGDRVEVRSGTWLLTLDSFRVTADRFESTHVRLVITVPNPDEFRFSIAPQTAFTPIARLFGLQDIELGDREFDAAFVVKSNSPARVRQLFADESLRAGIRQSSDCSLALDGLEGQVDPSRTDEERYAELVLSCEGLPASAAELRPIYAIFERVLERLAGLDRG